MPIFLYICPGSETATGPNINGWRSINYIIMKIFKTVTLNEISEVGAVVGETIVCPTKENPNDYQVYVHRVKGIYTPCGKFTDLKTAIKYAERLENPSMIKQGYQIIELDHAQKLIIFYDQMNNEVLDYIHNSEQISDVVIPLEESGISIRFIVPKENEVQQMNRLHKRDEMVWFGQFLLSEHRRKMFATRYVGETLEQKLSEVHHSDFDNYQVWRKTNSDLYDMKLDENDSVVVTRNDFRGETEDRNYEMRTLHEMKIMCEQSLDPENFSKFEDIVNELVKNRKGLKGN